MDLTTDNIGAFVFIWGLCVLKPKPHLMIKKILLNPKLRQDRTQASFPTGAERAFSADGACRSAVKRSSMPSSVAQPAEDPAEEPAQPEASVEDVFDLWQRVKRLAREYDEDVASEVPSAARPLLLRSPSCGLARRIATSASTRASRREPTCRSS